MTRRYSPLSGTEHPIESGGGWNSLRATEEGELCEVAESIADPLIILRDGEPMAVAGPRVLALLKRAGSMPEEVGQVKDTTSILESVRESLEEMLAKVESTEGAGALIDTSPLTYAIGELGDEIKTLGEVAERLDDE